MHAAIDETRASTPAQVRAVISKLALSGALGPEAKARRTANAAAADRTHLADIELILILHLLDSCGADLATLMADPARWRDSGCEGRCGRPPPRQSVVKRQDIYRRIGELSRLLAPVGLVATHGADPSGWLRVLHDEIEGSHRAPPRPPSGCRRTSVRIWQPSPRRQDAPRELVRRGARDARLRGARYRRDDEALEYRVAGSQAGHRAAVADAGRMALTDEAGPRRAARPARGGAAQLRVVRSMLPRLPDGDPAGQCDAPAGCPA